ncbi:MAG TPA: ATP-binding protein, partial [Microvirga sp.]|nr:ATP-binding protein [Microvirga sp.]
VNAKDAMPQGGTLTITCGEAVAGPDQGALPIGQDVVFVTVSDTGTGMSPEVAERAFEPFFTTKEVGKGSGLGLSMVYGFAQQSGGHVSIESRPGEGTAVTILLPAVDAGSPENADDAGPARLGRGRVLVVEGEPQRRHLVCTQLADLGCAVEAASTGADALDALTRDARFDVLLLGAVLPQGQSGVELAQRARGINPGFAVILASDRPEGAPGPQGPLEPGTVLLHRPFRHEDLAAALRQVLDPDRRPGAGEPLRREEDEGV